MLFIDLKKQVQRYKKEIDQAIQQTLDQTDFIEGTQVQHLENALSIYTQSHAITCSSGTDALYLALKALNPKPGSEIITTPFSFAATVETIIRVGAKPVFVDIREDTFLMNEDLIEPYINENTIAILPVSLFGQPSNMKKINRLAQKFSLSVIEDAAQSFGSEHQDHKSCNLSHIGVTSFFPTKPLGCFGDGGAIFSQDKRILEQVRILKNHGQSSKFKHDTIGINSRLDSMQAGILSVKLKYLENEMAQRQEIASFYKDAISNTYKEQYVHSENRSAWAQYSLQTPNRNTALEKLKGNNIPFAIYYPMPLHQQKAYCKYLLPDQKLSVAEKVSQEIFQIPIHPFLSKEDQEAIVKALNS